MKIRNGFISNSSSSSFVVAFKVAPICKHCGQKTKKDLFDLVAVAGGRSKLTESINILGFIDDQTVINTIRNFKKTDGWTLGELTLDNYDNVIRDYINTSNDVEVIWSDDF